jgi:hypothetical protein
VGRGVRHPVDAPCLLGHPRQFLPPALVGRQRSLAETPHDSHVCPAAGLEPLTLGSRDQFPVCVRWLDRHAQVGRFAHRYAVAREWQTLSVVPGHAQVSMP